MSEPCFYINVKALTVARSVATKEKSGDQFAHFIHFPGAILPVKVTVSSLIIFHAFSVNNASGFLGVQKYSKVFAPDISE